MYLTDDLKVAIGAAVCAVGVTLVLQFGFGVGSVIPRVAPLVVYFIYLFAAKDSDGPLDSVPLWVGLTVVVSVVVVLLYAFV